MKTATATVTSSSQAGGGFSSGTVAGIATASAVGALFVAGVALFVVWTRRKRRAESNSEPAMAQGDNNYLTNPNRYPIAEAPESGHGRLELDAGARSYPAG
jgi:hypothetical protein